ncbi:hypothetical protein RvY_19252 [Ramazzottius varieornatus]|uniref:RGS domain-containing protein n=1 Tax=Ramazzottius varieornatus TaxID=947166 RepID=A0A1D1W8T5_RAMVA|nr:hypothetical protein RvY_19252 [Ramazzottius varieornatus]
MDEVLEDPLALSFLMSYMEPKNGTPFIHFYLTCAGFRASAEQLLEVKNQRRAGGELVMEGMSADLLAESDSFSQPLDDKDLPSCSVPVLPTLDAGEGDADLFGDLESLRSGGQRRNDVPWNKLSRDSGRLDTSVMRIVTGTLPLNERSPTHPKRLLNMIGLFQSMLFS